MKNPDDNRPPGWPLHLLRLLVKKEYLEEIEGDMEELFHDNVERLSIIKAKRIYTWEMIKLLRPVLIKNLKEIKNLNPSSMLQNYYKTSMRCLIKAPLTSFINIIGLSVAIGICLVVYAFIDFDFSIDSFHKNKNEIYLVTHFGDIDGNLQQHGTTPRPIGELLKEDFAQIKKMCRIEDGNVIVKHQDNIFHERLRYTDPEFLEMFTFPLKWGTSKSLSDINSIVISESMSLKYFGEDNPVGKDILVKFDEKISKVFTVTGVAEPFPEAHIIAFDFLINYSNLRVSNPDYDFNNWSKFISATLIQVSNPSDLKIIEKGMEKYKRLQNEVEEDWAISRFAFEKLTTLHLHSRNIRNGISYDYSSEARVALPIIALFMLALACFNYVNIAIVSVAKRLKEIGVRKVIGANRIKIIIQFISENVLMTSFALILGLILAISFFLPWFIQIAQLNMKINLFDLKLWFFLGSIMVLTGIISGLYPAFYISKFEAVTIFKGSIRFGKKNPMTKVFLSFQLIMACILITGAITYMQNTAYLGSRSWGYNPKTSLYVKVPSQAAFEQLKFVMMQNPNVLSISGSSHHLGRDIASAVIHTPERNYEVQQLSVDANYLETMELKLKSGRFFRENYASDKQAVVVNERLVRNMELSRPLGQQFEIDSSRYEVIGVVKDFHIYSFYEEIKPVIFKVANAENYHYLSLKAKEGSLNEVFFSIKDQWATLFPETPFLGEHQEDVWSWFYRDLETQVTFTSTIAFIAVLLASLGLYGLVTLNVSGRIKEFSIKKVMGAGFKNMANNIIESYVWLTSIALIIGAPISYILIKAQLSMLYPDPIPMGFSSVAIAMLILIFVLLAVVSTQIIKVLRSNPVQGLNAE